MLVFTWHKDGNGFKKQNYLCRCLVSDTDVLPPSDICLNYKALDLDVRGIWKAKLCTVLLHILQQAKDGPVMRNEEKKGGKRWTSEFRALWRYEDDLITYKLSLHCEREVWGGVGEREEKWAIGASELGERLNALGLEEQSVLVGLS